MTDSWWSAKLSTNSSLQAESTKCKDTVSFTRTGVWNSHPTADILVKMLEKVFKYN